MIRAVAYPLALLAMVSSAQALTLAECTRTTHVSHGGEADHVDLNEGRVMWRDWWSQEGTYSDYIIADCGPGDALRFRVAEERMSERLPFDRTDAALKIVDEMEAGARAFATLERMGDAVAKVAKDVQLTAFNAEPCACAAAYPDLRGTKTDFEMRTN
ncbi:MAG: hypothetical protein AAGJ28_24275 [Pseudomonadota bacterium]